MPAIIYLVMLLIGGLGVGVALGAAAILAAVTGDASIAWPALVQRAAQGITSFPLLAVPFFILAAEVMNESGLTNRLFNFASVLVGHFRGGLAQVNVAVSLLFSGMSGSAVADVAGVGRIEIAAMTKRGYTPAFSGAVTAASATIGPVIPPSIPFIIFASLASVSPGALLIAGAIPGIMMAIGMMFVIFLLSVKRGYPREAKARRGDIWRTFRQAFLPLLTIVILLGGILSGIVTPTEAAIVASAYAIFLALVVYRVLTLRQLWQVFGRVGIQTAVIMFIISMASVFALVVTRMGLPQALARAVISTAGGSAVAVLVLAVVLLLIVGMFMETAAALVVLTPILVPVVVSIGVNPIHFGVIMVLTLMIGLITPPFGINALIVSDIAKVSFGSLTRELVPFFAILLAVVAILIVFPEISLWLPEMILG
ncbi:TRAP transporter large permease [Cryobacterium sp. Y62]|uniref:TRAP transporter large permease n=1 Tax=Cryobacterium sp. Y62 TaxID=2048284 RepID=UPI000CE5488D|nr:TRAP transporter large permease [Cryobacterium sp. Y62]